MNLLKSTKPLAQRGFWAISPMVSILDPAELKICKFSLRITWIFASSALFLGIEYSPTVAQSLIIPDDTLMPGERSQAITDFLGLPVELVVGGAQRGSNLFHSFEEFSVQAGRSAYFDNPAGITNIFSRVTGFNPSEILGTLGVLDANNLTQGTANLYFVNPNGILFGPAASLDLLGSFTATTASAIGFENQGVFSAIAPDNPGQLLTIDPSAYLFNQLVSQPSNTIESQAFIRVPNGQNIFLLGGNVVLNNSILRASNGRIEIGSIEDSGEVNIRPEGSLDYSKISQNGNINLFNQSVLLIGGNGEGEITLTADNISLSDNSSLVAGLGIGAIALENGSGAIRLNAADSVSLDEFSVIFNLVNPNAQGTGGDIEINASDIFVLNGSQIGSTLLGQGEAGNITLNAEDQVVFSGVDSTGQFFSAALTIVEASGQGRGGEIRINANQLEVSDGALISSGVLGEGEAGNIIINVFEDVLFQGTNGTYFSGILSNVEPGAVGSAGNVEIKSRSFAALDGAVLSSSLFGQGRAGNITIEASDSILLSGVSEQLSLASAVGSIVAQGAIGDGGTLRFETGYLSVLDGANILTSTFGQGNAGRVIIAAEDSVLVKGSGLNGQLVSAINSNVESLGIGNGGDINIFTTELSVLDGGAISASTLGSGDAGNIFLSASDSLEIDGVNKIRQISSALSSLVSIGATGNGGDILIFSGDLLVSNGGRIDATTGGSGNAGNIEVAVENIINLTGYSSLSQGLLPSTITGTSASLGNGGLIRLNAESIFISDMARVTSSSSSDGQSGTLNFNATRQFLMEAGLLVTESEISSGGDIAVTAGTIQLLGNSDIRTSLFGGTASGGNITLNADFIFAFDDSDILAFAPQGQGGNITFNTRALFTSPPFQPAPPTSDLATLLGLLNNDRVDINASGAVAGAITGIPDISFLEIGLIQLPVLALDTNSLVAGSCIVRTPDNTGSFVISGGGALPETPDSGLRSRYPTGQVRTPSQTINSSSSQDYELVLQEPDGVFQLPDGRIALSRECPL